MITYASLSLELLQRKGRGERPLGNSASVILGADYRVRQQDSFIILPMSIERK